MFLPRLIRQLGSLGEGLGFKVFREERENVSRISGAIGIEEPLDDHQLGSFSVDVGHSCGEIFELVGDGVYRSRFAPRLFLIYRRKQYSV